MSLIVITPPTEEPITLDEAKEQCRVNHSEQDNLLTGHVMAARQWVEEMTNLALTEQTFELVLDQFPRCAPSYVPSVGRIVLPRSPLIAVVSVKYLDSNGDEQTLDPSNYIVDADSVPPRITPAPNSGGWPTTQYRINAVRVRFRAGFVFLSDSPETNVLPEPLRQALMLKVQSLYDGADFDETIDRLLGPWRVWGV